MRGGEGEGHGFADQQARDVLTQPTKKSPEVKPAARTGSRFIDEQDAREFAVSAKIFLAGATASKATAIAKLIELGIIESDGKLGKNYR